MERITLTTQPQKDYELLDMGGGEKFERYGSVRLVRPDPQALWEKTLGEGEWAKADGRFVRSGQKGEWQTKPTLPKEWQIEFGPPQLGVSGEAGGLKFLIRPTSFKHTGLFPEQLSNWEWAKDLIEGCSESKAAGVHEFSAENSLSPRAVALRSPLQPSFASAPSVLNLFGYTGGASLACAQAGAKVTHVDASKTAITWARENAALSGLAEGPIRWITEDVLVFVRREIKRGSRYDAIIMDPPAFGHGPKDELWKIEEHLVELIKLCMQLLSDTPLFFLINGYAASYSPLAFAYNLEPLIKKCGGKVEYGEIAIAQQGSDRVLPCGIFARWSAAK